mmetsp:Transcript_119449/g.254891  ORF Transcript_119449/g.254891 Transcript_119449/m.254891 type:complete len:323 (+) Transcript_119449:1591-2559(+)
MRHSFCGGATALASVVAGGTRPFDELTRTRTSLSPPATGAMRPSSFTGAAAQEGCSEAAQRFEAGLGAGFSTTAGIGLRTGGPQGQELSEAAGTASRGSKAVSFWMPLDAVSLFTSPWIHRSAAAARAAMSGSADRANKRRSCAASMSPLTPPRQAQASAPAGREGALQSSEDCAGALRGLVGLSVGVGVPSGDDAGFSAACETRRATRSSLHPVVSRPRSRQALRSSFVRSSNSPASAAAGMAGASGVLAPWPPTSRLLPPMVAPEGAKNDAAKSALWMPGSGCAAGMLLFENGSSSPPRDIGAAVSQPSCMAARSSSKVP